MAKIVKPPRPKRVRCDECGATIEYLPEDVQEFHGTDMGGGPDGCRWVDCPRITAKGKRCQGSGIIESW